VWYRLARHLALEATPPAAKVQVEALRAGDGSLLRVLSHRGEELARYLDASPVRLRFLSRLGRGVEGFDRAALLERLATFQLTPEEWTFHKAGMPSNRQKWEESFWHRLAYHAVREFEETSRSPAGTFHPAIDETSGRFTLTYRREGRGLIQLTVPRASVEGALRLLAAAFPGQEDLALHPVPLKSIFHVSPTTELDLEVRPAILALQENGEERFYAQEELARFRYGNLVYLPTLGVLAALERPGSERRFRAPARLRLTRSQVPKFLEEYSLEVEAGAVVIDESLRGIEILSSYDEIRITPGASPALSEEDLETALERSWAWLAVEYGFGNQAVSLGSLLEAHRQGHPYLETPAGWIDLRAPALRHLEGLLERLGDEELGREDLPLTPGELLGLAASAQAPVRPGGEGPVAEGLARLLEGRPRESFRQPEGLASPLRPYQRLGAEWLRFLWEHRLGGLLADDMGLGKTHQAMALMVSLVESGETPGPFLVVCPTTVLPHWQAKIRDHAPALTAVLHHGPQRDLAAALDAGNGSGGGHGRVLLTSYGVLRRDAAALAEVPFAVVFLDEAQQIKNPGTQAHEAAARLAAEVKLALSGTPIENSLEDLKALFDLVLPGYLGDGEAFSRRFAAAEGERQEEIRRRREDLRRFTSPFILRRRKASVLDELPEKFEDVRLCALSDDQIKLYRDAIATQGARLAAEIEAAQGPLPYIHVFALLNLLKRICDHPALALKELDRAEEYASGKWDLYREILGEALDSGHKVVVFTQYLGMITLMERHLEEAGVGCVRLTGASRRRGEIVDRFNRDEDCRVFLGSLKAGGTGIDLVGGSVVVHYDRWWNAAREDQATDRVHRIGQRRAVQVVKLVTEGTLEEKIAALIAQKRRLLDEVVQEDDPALSKVFTRDELLDLLAPV
jgi:superfamily II DNA or RNA helicase